MGLLGKFLKKFAKPHWFSYLLGIVFLVATTALTVAIPSFVESAVDALAPRTGAGDPRMAMTFAWAIVGAGLGIIVVRTLSRVLFFNPGRSIEYALKSVLFRHLTRLPNVYYAKMSPGELVSRGTNDATAVRSLIGFGVLMAFNVALTLLMAVGKMFQSDWQLALWVLIPLALAMLVLRRAIRELFRLMRETQEVLASLSAQSLELYGGASVLQSLNAVDLAQGHFEKENQALLAIGRRVAFVTSWLLPVVQVVGDLCLVILLFIGGNMVVNGRLSAGELAAFAVLIRIAAGSLNMLGWTVNSLQRGWIGLERIYEVLDAPADLPGNGHDAVPPIRSEEQRGYRVEVKDLNFQYPERPGEPGMEVGALTGISFVAEPGQTVGIFGGTGSGKTTLLDLLSRVQEPPLGSIFVEGVDVRSLDLPAYHEVAAYVPQEAWLFSQSIRSNIALGDREEERDEARVQDALVGAALSRDLKALPDGLDTRVGERGVMLSGGQRQRTALARAFYRDFNMLLLDDVLSAVDHATEQQLIDAIYARRKGATTFIVSHRVSALRHADKILVLDGGQVVDRGTHEELLARPDGSYRRAWRLQQVRLEAEQRQRGAQEGGGASV